MDTIHNRLFQKQVGRGEKALFLLSRVKNPTSVVEIRNYGVGVGFREIAKWNISDILRKQLPYCVLRPNGWELTNEGEQLLTQLGYAESSPLVSKTRGDLEAHVHQITSPARKRFAQEAVACFNNGLQRASVVLSWVGAIYILQEKIVKDRLADFNKAAALRFGKNFRTINSIEHFSRIQEADILQISEDIGLVDKSMKNQLIERLNLRNTCGHPNMVIVDDHNVAHHIEFLLNNIYKRF